jgi:hypothetical protein
LTIKASEAFVRQYHRHSSGRGSGKFAVAAQLGHRTVGVGLAGRPSAIPLDDGRTIEVLRVCTDGTENACSFLYGALHRIARTMGYSKAITYTLATEPGSSLRAVGYKAVADVKPDHGDRPGRPRVKRAPVARCRWERGL